MANRHAAHGDPTSEEVIKAVRQKCLDCCCGSKKAVEECQIKSCALLPYRCLSATRMTKPTEKQAEIITLFDDLPKRANI